MQSGSGVFEKQGDLYVPTEAALSPWGTDRLHGGPVLGLLLWAAQQALPEPQLRLVRMTGDLFARVPNAPLRPQLSVVRAGRRIWLCDVVLLHESQKLARASFLWMRAGQGTHRVLDQTHPPGPEGQDERPLVAASRRHKMPAGFHTEIETRFGSERGENRVVWFRMPMPLCSGEAADPLTAAVTLSDFNNAVTSISAYESARPSSHMNTDTTLYLERLPVGEWFAMRADTQSDCDGISVGQVVHYDVQGRFGRSLQARLEAEFNPGAH